MSIIIPTSAFRSNGRRYLQHRAASHFISPIQCPIRDNPPPLSPLLRSLVSLRPSSALSPSSASTLPHLFVLLLHEWAFLISPLCDFSFLCSPLARVPLFACAIPTCFSTIPPGATMTERPIYISWTRNFHQLVAWEEYTVEYGGNVMRINDKSERRM